VVITFHTLPYQEAFTFLNAVLHHYRTALLAKIGVFALDAIGGGIVNMASYIMRAPDWTWRGVMDAFAWGAEYAGFFVGLGAALVKVASVLAPLASKFWKWFRYTPSGEPINARTMVAAALDGPPRPSAPPMTARLDSNPPPATTTAVPLSQEATSVHVSLPLTVSDGTSLSNVSSRRRTPKDLIPGTPEHKAWAWEEYQKRVKSARWSYERWSKQYDANMQNAKRGLEREAAYRAHFGGESRVLKIRLPDGTVAKRQVDIYKPGYAGQLKTGKESLNAKNRRAIMLDAILVKQGFRVEWILEQDGYAPLLQALRDAGIEVFVGSKIP